MKGISTLVLVLLALSVEVTAEPLAYVVNSDDVEDADRLLQIDLATGATTELMTLPASFADVEGLAVSRDNALFGVDGATKQLIRIDLADFSVTSPGFLGFSLTDTLDFGLTATCDNALLMVAEQTQSLYSVTVETGAARVIQGSGMLGAPMTAIASYQNRTVALDNTGMLYTVDIEAATASPLFALQGFPTSDGDGGLSFDAAGNLWAISSDNGSPSQIYAIDLNTSTSTRVATSRPGIESLAMGNNADCQAGGMNPLLPVEVPVNSPWALASLMAFLSLFAAFQIRRLHH